MLTQPKKPTNLQFVGSSRCPHKTNKQKNMNKFELKEKLIKLAENIEADTRDMMTPATDKETGEIRATVYSAMAKAREIICNEIYGIY